MKIPPPTDNELPLAELVEKAHDWVTWYLSTPPWICLKCGLLNFGRNKKCAGCKSERPQ